ncbi:MAG: hypothetical protein AB201_02740 [Parcubacteria bacterium C7867-006]|nr:MAG: hypothetical protein AB201_02740 [Parcubacteria bacterium C7867-006]
MQIDNARHSEQVARMQEAEKKNECFFCIDFTSRGASGKIWENPFWFVKPNDYPYNGAEHHYLVVAQRHVTEIRELSTHEKLALFEAVEWIKNRFELDGFSVFVRSGNMRRTAATIDHLHFHVIVGGEKVGDEKNKLEDLIVAPVGFKKK